METAENIKASVHALVCFDNIQTAKAMSETAAYLAFSGPENSSITFIHLIDEDVDPGYSVNEDDYQSDAFKSLVAKFDRNKFSVRTFIKKASDYIAEIKKITKEQNFNLLIYGMSNENISPSLCSRLSRLKGDPKISETEIKEQFKPNEWFMMNRATELFNMNPVATYLFINNNIKELNRFFVPILCATDVNLLSNTITRLARKEGAEIMIWDAIGVIEKDQKVQKIYNNLQRINETKVSLWDIDKKIETGFILQQDICVLSVEGWNKLLRTNLPWIEKLPTTLIIKTKTT